MADKRISYIAFVVASLLALADTIFVCWFSLYHRWAPFEVRLVAVVYFFMSWLFDVGRSGTWLPSRYPSATTPSGLRALMAIGGFLLLLLAFGLTFVDGHGRLTTSSVGLILGICVASQMLIRRGILGGVQNIGPK